jgi:hypothetical protein
MVGDATDYIGSSRWKSVRHPVRNRVIEGCGLTWDGISCALCGVVCATPWRARVDACVDAPSLATRAEALKAEGIAYCVLGAAGPKLDRLTHRD